MAAGSLDGFLRHGHWVGFRGMAAGSLDGVTLSTGFRGFWRGVPSWSTPYTLVGLRMPKTLIIVLLLHNF